MSFFSMQGHCMLQTTSTHSGDNFLGFDTVPDRVLDGSAVRVRYQCSRPCQLTLEVVVSVLKKTDLVVFRRKWISSVLKGHRIHQVLLRLPPSISYQLDFFNRNILDSHNMTVRACMDYFKNSSELSTFDSSRWRIFKEIQTLDLSERPSKPPPGCPSWSAQLMWRITSQHIHQCLHEPVVLDMLNFPMASSGGHFGLVHRFQPFLDRTLEKARLLAVTQPSVTLSLWIYQVESCHKQLCGIIHHVNRKNNFDSVMLQLTGTGDIVFQVRSTTGTDKAFRANTKLPLWKWIRLDCYIKGSKVMLDTVWDDETRRYVYEFQDGIYYDDTDGYFVIGGGKYLPGIHGYFGPVKYYRFGIEKQYSLQLIYLNNEDDLKKLTPETSDAFQYLNYKAERGDAQSQKHLASLLYWGQNGLSKDIATAMKWFERSAMQMNDPTAMYDYSVLLMKGHGVKKNYTQGFWLLRKAAEMGSINALNGLGWYYEMVLKDHKSAVKYYEQAALNGSGDGIFNLGVYHLTGKIPGSPEQNESAAFQHFLNASKSGHMSASVEVARYLSTGNLEGVSQDVEKAVIILKNVCDRNGHLGFMIREALQAYLQDSRWESFVNYVLAAESGLGLAQSNTAHLCEELGLSDDCQRRYHNFSVLNHDPHPSALLKMGDYFYYSSSTQADSLSLAEQAISMYGRAALAGSPQGMYNLVVLVHEGHIFPRSINSFFNVSHRDEVHTVMEKILKRCVAIEDEELVTPCSFALLGLQMGKALRRMSQNDVQLLLAYMSLLSVIMVIIFVPLQSCLGQRNHETLRIRSARQQSGNLNQEQVSIMGTSEPVTRNQRLMQLDSQQWLPYASELVVTLSGVCLCVFWTTVLCHVL
uniref:Protein sel-1 homolog 3-like n=1 Tax=Gouania willdenowi TaxID=441366 RepID=A0A8C5H8P0_GOUWI